MFKYIQFLKHFILIILLICIFIEIYNILFFGQFSVTNFIGGTLLAILYVAITHYVHFIANPRNSLIPYRKTFVLLLGIPLITLLICFPLYKLSLGDNSIYLLVFLISSGCFIINSIFYSVFYSDMVRRSQLSSVEQDKLKYNLLFRYSIPFTYFIFIPFTFFKAFSALGMAGLPTDDPAWFWYKLSYQLNILYFIISLGVFLITLLLEYYKKYLTSLFLLIVNYTYLMSILYIQI